jgi:SAM-dependent methyltransferase
MSADRHWLRSTFDEDPALYDSNRPVCPAQLFDDLLDLAHLRPGDRIVEIGCGTGQATLPLAKRGCVIMGIELGPHLAELARRKLAAFPNVTIVNAPFEAWDAADARFDGIVCFNAFHWLDPDLRFAKCAEVLREDGALVIVGTPFVHPDDADPFWTEVQEDYAAIQSGPAGQPPVHPDAVGDLSAEIDASGFFHTVAVRRYLWNKIYTADEYIGHLSTASWHRQLEPDVRRVLFEHIQRRIAIWHGGAVTASFLSTLNVAQRT